MKFFLCLSVAVLAAAVSAAEDKKDATATDRPKTFRRLIPADVLRGKCLDQKAPQWVGPWSTECAVCFRGLLQHTVET
jgi:hypothetical protein